MSIVNLVNVGDTPVTFNGNERFTIPVGKSQLVPWEVAAAWLGNPACTPDERGPVYQQTRLLWGFSAGLDTDDEWEADKRPKVEVYDTTEVDETGNPRRILMLLEDPDGTRGSAAPAGYIDIDAAEVGVLRSEVGKLQGQVDQLMAALRARENIVELEPSDALALSTVAAGVGVDGATSELPKPVATDPSAADKPRTGKVRG